MKTNRMKKLVCSAAILTLVLTATACGGNNGETPDSTAPAASPTGSVTPTPPTATDSASPSSSPEVLTASGEYVGLIDGHSVEIKVDGNPAAYQISPETMEKVSPWAEGTKVKFSYTENTLDVDGQQVKQMTMMEIDKE